MTVTLTNHCSISLLVFPIIWIIFCELSKLSLPVSLFPAFNKWVIFFLPWLGGIASLFLFDDLLLSHYLRTSAIFLRGFPTSSLFSFLLNLVLPKLLLIIFSVDICPVVIQSDKSYLPWVLSLPLLKPLLLQWTPLLWLLHYSTVFKPNSFFINSLQLLLLLLFFC